jgi:hypothetical protein
MKKRTVILVVLLAVLVVAMNVNARPDTTICTKDSVAIEVPEKPEVLCALQKAGFSCPLAPGPVCNHGPP